MEENDYSVEEAEAMNAVTRALLVNETPQAQASQDPERLSVNSLLLGNSIDQQSAAAVESALPGVDALIEQGAVARCTIPAGAAASFNPSAEAAPVGPRG